MKTLLAIAGSPRRGGNSDLLLEEVIRASRQEGIETTLLRVSELNLSPCTACGACWKNGECAINDEMQAVYNQLVEAHYIVIASPVYFLGVTAQLKALIDRCQSLWVKNLILRKPIRNDDIKPKGLFISTAALNKGDHIFAGSIQTIRAMLYSIGVEYKGEILCYGLKEKGSVKDHPKMLEKVYQATKQLLLPETEQDKINLVLSTLK